MTSAEVLVTIRSFSSESEAEIAKSALESFGIKSMISTDDCGGQRPHLAVTGGLRLIVRADEAEQAEDVLKNEGEEPL